LLIAVEKEVDEKSKILADHEVMSTLSPNDVAKLEKLE